MPCSRQAAEGLSPRTDDAARRGGMELQAGYPTARHATAAHRIVELVKDRPPVDAVLLFCSCARGKATVDSCLDIAVLLGAGAGEADRRALEAEWTAFNADSPDLKRLREAGAYSEVHLDFIDGEFLPRDPELGGLQDSFELEVGNYVVSSFPLWQRGDRLARLRSQWLPFYPEDLRAHRLDMVRRMCRNNLRHIPLYAARGLYFQCFDRLYNAYREMLQAVFISRRVYPIAYNKWIREQVEEWLGLPDLYRSISHLFEIRSFESEELVRRASQVEELLERYAPAERIGDD
jgi:predicted nucleotidyltransferase